MRNLFNNLGRHRSSYIATILVSVVLASAEALIHPLLIKAIFDTATTGGKLGTVLTLGVAYLAFGLVMIGLNLLATLWNVRLNNKVVSDFSTKMLTAFYERDYKRILADGDGYYIARIRSDVKEGLIPLLASTRSIITSVSTFIALVTVLFVISPAALLMLGVIIPLAAFVSIKVSKKIQSITKTERDGEAVLLDWLSKAINSFKIVTIFNFKSQVIQTVQGKIDVVLDAGYKKSRLIALYQTSGDVVMVVSDACSILVGSFLVFTGRMTIGSFIAFMNAFWRASTTLMAIFKQLADWQSYNAVFERIISFPDEAACHPRTAGGKILALKNVGFRYTDEAMPVLNEVSFSLDAGDRALILGQNGTGKSTLANLIAGNLKPTSGLIQLPTHIRAVTLPVRLPPLEFAELKIEPHLIELFDLSNAFASGIPLDQLSAGQQQKTAIAIGLSKKADLFVFDEPLANLDDSSRVTIMNEILNITKGAILVVVMHDAERYQCMFDKVVTLGESPGC